MAIFQLIDGIFVFSSQFNKKCQNFRLHLFSHRRIPRSKTSLWHLVYHLDWSLVYLKNNNNNTIMFVDTFYAASEKPERTPENIVEANWQY